MSVPDSIRDQLRRVVEDLRDVRYRLIGAWASVPPSPQETSLADLNDDLDAPAEIRSVVSNCINDRLDPLIEDLAAVAEYGLTGPVSSPDNRTKLD